MTSEDTNSATSVYPRACGGTGAVPVTICDTTGLSPRLRGNQRECRLPSPFTRSIPAPAGEPLAGHRPGPPRTVYPRACGGTEFYYSTRQGGDGLSPRLRGNLAEGRAGPGEPGSIPAPAGEPGCCTAGLRTTRVYPRACGGTGDEPGHKAMRAGLSPRLRGNRLLPGQARVALGSIPAPAGEPKAS